MKTCLTLVSIAITLTSGRAGDRVYTAGQTSNTVSVIDPATNKYLGALILNESAGEKGDYCQRVTSSDGRLVMCNSGYSKCISRSTLLLQALRAADLQ